MGRYYYTNSGLEGKFGFGTQPSDDPAYFGMCEDNFIHYYLTADDDTVAEVRTKIDEQYKILHIPKSERVYKFEDGLQSNLTNLINKYKNKNWHNYTEEDDAEKKTRYAYGNETITPNNKDVPLAECRLYLGVTIMTDLLNEGECGLEAEC